MRYAGRMNSSPMARTLGILSAVLLVLGATGPLAKALLMTAYLGDVSPTRVTLLILIAGAAVACGACATRTDSRAGRSEPAQVRGPWAIAGASPHHATVAATTTAT